MKKISIIVICALFSLSVGSCANDADASLTEAVDSAFTHDFEAVYKAACEYLGVKYDKCLSLIEKRDVIRKADLQDVGGDVLAEMPEYDTIVRFIWPNGYGKF